jgi:hypothetical protein
MNRVVLKALVAVLAGVVAAGACGGVTTTESRGGSETNWLSICATDSDCDVGRCLCGVCSEACDPNRPCSHDRDVCVVQATRAFHELCQARVAAPPGVCLDGCGDGCVEGFTCIDGACVLRRDNAVLAVLGLACTPGDEARPNFSGYRETEVNLESRSPSCSSGICLVNAFRGRTSCPGGQPDPSRPTCFTTGDNPVPVTVPVEAWLPGRPPESSVYCSCRCAAPAGAGPLCACPDGFECTKLVDAYGTDGGAQLAGSYCTKTGTP